MLDLLALVEHSMVKLDEAQLPAGAPGACSQQQEQGGGAQLSAADVLAAWDEGMQLMASAQVKHMRHVAVRACACMCLNWVGGWAGGACTHAAGADLRITRLTHLTCAMCLRADV